MTGPLTYVADHADRAFERLPGRDREAKPVLEALARAVGEGCQVLEDEIADLILGRGLEGATGAALDQWGAIVGEARGVLEDGDYRRFVMARILANTCKGDVEGVLAVWRLVTAPSSSVRLRHLYPGYELIVVRAAFLSEDTRRRVRRIMADVAPPWGVSQLVEALDGYVGDADDPLSTGFDSGPLARIL